MNLFASSIPRDWFDWSTASVGFVGLALTLLAVRQATGAKRAATEAREAIWKRDASDSFAELARVAGQVAESLSLERPSEAAVRLRDLVARLPRDRARFERFLAGDSAKLVSLESDLQELAVRLSAARFFEEKDEAEAAINAVLNANRGLNAVHGRLMARLDGEDK